MSHGKRFTPILLPLLGCLTALILAAAGYATAGPAIPTQVLSGGGGDAVSASFRFSHSVAQGPIGLWAAGSTREFRQGFWNTMVESVPSCEQWSVTLGVTGSGVTDYRTFGEHCLGTDGYDAGLDVIIPPPGFTFYSYLQGIAPYAYLSTSVKSSEPDSVAWYLAAVNAEDFIVSWYPESLPEGYALYIDGVDMNTVDHIDRFGGQSLLIYAKRSACDPPTPPADCLGSQDLCDRVHLSWQDSSANEQGFEIRRDGGVIDTAAAGVTAFDDWAALPGIVSEYCVAAFNACGMSQFCCAQGARLEIPVAPGNVSASSGGACPPSITWDDISGETGYRIYRGGGQIDSVAANVTTYDDLGAEPGSVYEYCVTAFNSCGESSVGCDEGGCVGCSGVYKIPDGLQASVGQVGFKVPIMGTSGCDIKGFSVCVKVDPDVFVVNSVVYDSSATSASGSQMITASSTDTTAKVGVVYSFACPPQIPAGDHPPLPPFIYLVLDVKATAPTGPTPIRFEDIGLAKNRMTACDGTTIAPVTIDGYVQIVSEQFIRGDDDGDGELTISDPILSLCAQFGSGCELHCLDASDVDDDGEITISDCITNLCAQFGSCPPPGAPFPDCGPDPTPDGLDCVCHDYCMGCGFPLARSDARVKMWLGTPVKAGLRKVAYPVYLENTQALLGYECTVSFPTSVLAFEGATREPDEGQTDEFFSAAERATKRGVVHLGNVLSLDLSASLGQGVHEVGRLVFRQVGQSKGTIRGPELVSGKFVSVGMSVGEARAVESPYQIEAGASGVESFMLTAAPNPTGGSTSIRYGLAEAGRVEIVIFNTAGQVVRSLGSGEVEAGMHEVVWDGCNARGEAVPNGIYFCRISTPDKTEMRKVVVVR